MKRVVVVGGGIAGLATAFHLSRAADSVPGGLEILVLEAADRAGGNIQTDHVDGFTIERGPNGYLDNVPTTPALVRALDLDGQIQKADESAANRFLFCNGRLHALPTGPLGFLTNPVLSLPGRLRVFLEPFARRRPPVGDESIYEFASRRIGREAAEVLIDAMVSGVFAGDIRRLSLASSFPKMAGMEEEYGGLVRALVGRGRARRRARREVERRRRGGEEVDELVRPGGPAGPGGTLTSFREGLETLPLALETALAGKVRKGVRVASLTRDRGPAKAPEGDSQTAERGAFRVSLESGDEVLADAVILAIPARNAADTVEGMDPVLGAVCRSFPTAGLAVVALAFDGAGFTAPRRGFGFLVPRKEGIRTLGCLWDSSVFPGRAPGDAVLLRAMIGGAHDPQACGLDEDLLVRQVLEDLRTTMGPLPHPRFTRVYRWPGGIGQYSVGHQTLLDSIQERLDAIPGLWLAGSSYFGISMNACLEQAPDQARQVLSYLSVETSA